MKGFSITFSITFSIAKSNAYSIGAQTDDRDWDKNLHNLTNEGDIDEGVSRLRRAEVDAAAVQPHFLLSELLHH